MSLYRFFKIQSFVRKLFNEKKGNKISVIDKIISGGFCYENNDGEFCLIDDNLKYLNEKDKEILHSFVRNYICLENNLFIYDKIKKEKEFIYSILEKN